MKRRFGIGVTMKSCIFWTESKTWDGLRGRITRIESTSVWTHWMKPPGSSSRVQPVNFMFNGRSLRRVARLLIRVEGSSFWIMHMKHRTLFKSYFPWETQGKGENTLCKCNETFSGRQSCERYCVGVIRTSLWTTSTKCSLESRDQLAYSNTKCLFLALVNCHSVETLDRRPTWHFHFNLPFPSVRDLSYLLTKEFGWGYTQEIEEMDNDSQSDSEPATKAVKDRPFHWACR